MKKIITLTINPAIDTSLTAPELIAEHKIRCSASKSEPGGGGINISRVIKRLKGKSAAFYPAGGLNGRRLELLLQGEGITQDPISVSADLRENFIVYEESKNRQFRFVMPGAPLKSNEWKECLRSIIDIRPRPDYIVASGSIPPGVPEDFYSRLAGKLDKGQTRLVVDTSGRALKLAAEEGAFLLKPNLREFRELTGLALRDLKQQKRASAELVAKKNIESVVVSLGDKGAIKAEKGGCDLIRAPKVKVKSKVGAGDSMVAGIVFGLAGENTLFDAVGLGVCAGAAAVTTPGTELCRRGDTMRLYKNFTKRRLVWQE